MKQLLKKYFLIIGLVAIIVPIWVLAGPNDNVSGYAWSDMPDGSDEIKTPGNHYGGRGLGWIKLNGDLYGVNLNESTGAFDGYGWSEYGGWVDFSPSGPYPAGPNHGAQVDPGCLANTTQTCPITGWIRFTAGGSEQSGGWDGWVKMSGTNYGVQLGAADANGVRPMSGKAWGDMVAGWIDFKWAEVKTEIETCTAQSPDWNPITQTCQACNPTNANYNSTTGTCDSGTFPGCTDRDASNYNPDATANDGTCDVCINIEGNQNTAPTGYTIVPRWQCVSTTDVCPTTNYRLPGKINDGQVDQRTIGDQTTLPTVNGKTYTLGSVDASGYKVEGTDMCGIFGCPYNNPTTQALGLYNPDATIYYLGACGDIVDQCTNVSGVNYEIPDGYNQFPIRKCCPVGETWNRTKCVPIPIPGCMISGYDNYNSNATVNDGTCACTSPRVWNGTTCVSGGGSGGPKQPIIIEG